MERQGTDSVLNAFAPNWVVRFVSNLGVYLVFFLLGYLVLNKVRKSGEPDPSNPSLWARWVRFLFFGPPEQLPTANPDETPSISADGEGHVAKGGKGGKGVGDFGRKSGKKGGKDGEGEEAKDNPEDDGVALLSKDGSKRMVEKDGDGDGRTLPESFWMTSFKLVFCVVGLLTTFLSWGLLQERIMTTRYETGFFESSNFTVFCSRSFGWFMAYVITSFTEQQVMRAPFYQFSFTSFSNVMSSYCQLEALKYLSFPTQVLGKSSKMIPVMIMGKVISNKKYPVYEYVIAVIILAGVAMFMLAENEEKAQQSDRVTTTAGVVLLIGYLTFDSYTSQWQDYLFKQYKLSSYQMMLGVNSFSASLTLLTLLQSGEFFTSIDFVLKNKECLNHIILFSISGATGSMFIFYTIKQFGPLVFTMIMVTRQLIAIVLSCIFYGHEINSSGVAGAVMVFLAIGYRIYRKEMDKKREKERKRAEDKSG